MKTNIFLQGDAIEVMKSLPSESVDLIATDPPYNLGKDYGNNIDYQEWHLYEAFTEKWLTEAIRLLKPTGSLYAFMGVRFIAKLFTIIESRGMLFNGWITWHYTQGMGRRQGFSPRHEDILYFTKSDKYTFNLDEIRIPQKFFRKRNNMDGANPGDVWEFSHVHYSNPERVAHPTQKPLALMERIIKASTNKEGIVLDPFVGSGSTCLAANALGRKWVGIDVNPDYIKMADSRLKQEYQADSFDPRENRTPRDLSNNLTADLFASLAK
jgi:site-specific DNA-methyltransferase (adenine-specific)